MGSMIALHARYQYVGLLALTIVLCLILSRLGSLSFLGGRIKAALLLLWFAVAITGYVRSDYVLDQHAESRRLTAIVLAIMQARIGAQPAGQAVYIDNKAFGEIRPGLIPMTTFPGWAAVFVIFHPENRVDGRRVYFIERDPKVIAAASGVRTKGLLVPPPPPSGGTSPTTAPVEGASKP
jgi:hypothetical protein